jgi:hypothetical protein
MVHVRVLQILHIISSQDWSLLVWFFIPREYRLDWGRGWQVNLNLLLRKFASEVVKYLQSSGDLFDNIIRVF